MEDAPIYALACWCRNCDHAGKPGLSLGAALRIGPEFIVCPDCGNKRCPKGTNHELACTNSNEPGQKGSAWEHAIGFTALTAEQVEALNAKAAAALATPAPLHRAPGLLSAPQLDALAHALDEERQGCAAEPASPLGYWPSAVAGLLGHVAQMAEALDDEKAYGNQGIDHEFELMRKLKKSETRAAEAEAQVAMLRVEFGEQEVEKLALVQELAVEKAKTALLWPVATKQTQSHDSK